MRLRVDSGRYPGMRAFLADIDLLVANAETFNPCSRKDVRGRSITTVDGITYFNYVYVLEVPGTVSEGPSQAARFRRSISSSAVRNGYIYTLTFSSASSMWDEYGPDFFEATQQFRVDSSPEKNPKYRSPESAPWEIF